MIVALVSFIEQIALGLYILIAVAMFLSLRSYSRVGSEMRATHFELERELFRNQRANTLTTLVLLFELALIVVGLQLIVAPYLRTVTTTTIAFLNTEDDGEFVTPTPEPLLGGFEVDISGVEIGSSSNVGVQVFTTPTLTPTPVGTIVPNAPQPLGCDTPNATLQIPANGMRVFEPITVMGTAFTENFAFFKFELNGPATGGNYAALTEYMQSVEENGVLGQFVPAYYAAGEYRFRLSVFDNTNTIRASCTVTIYISEPIPTPTPLSIAPGT